MRSFIFFLGSLLSSALAIGQSVTLYSDCEFRGSSQFLGVGRYNLSSTRIGAFNLSSIRIPNGLKVILYNNVEPGMGNRKITLDEDSRCLRDQGWNDNAGSMVIEYEDGNRNNNYNNNYNNNSNNYSNRYDNYYNSGSGPITIYDDCNYGGRSYRMGIGYHRANDLGIGNDKLSSIRVPSGYRVTLYENDNFGGATTVITNDNSCVSRDWNDRTSSILVERNNYNNNYNNNYDNYYNQGNNKKSYNTPSGGMVTVYQDCNYGGSSRNLNSGYHRANDLGVGNDAISAIYVPRGWQVTLYYDDNFSGRSMQVSYSMECLPKDWNDKVSSIFVSRTGL
jgi:hypothetical protein